MALLTFEQRNPYVSATPRVAQKRSVKPVGLLAIQQQEEQDTGLLGEPVEPQNKVQYDQQQLTSHPADQNLAIQQYYQNYMNALEEQQQQKDQQAMVKAGVKTAKKYATNYELGTGTAGNAAAAQQGYGSLDHANYNEVANTIDDAGGAEAVNADAGSGGGGSSGGSYLGAATGALGGYQRGLKNYYTDPKMRSGEDGFGKYWHDARAEVGGGVTGGVLGYYAPYLSGLSGPVVEAIHPLMEELTRNSIMAGDSLGGVTGAMMFDPIGTMASGKYSKDDITKSALMAPLGPLNIFNSGSDSVKSIIRNPSPKNVIKKLKSIF